MEVRDILKKAIIAVGGDGLVHLDTECGCGVDDLICCDDACHGCEVARVIKKGDSEWNNDWEGEVMYLPMQVNLN